MKDEIWKTTDGTEIEVKDMEESHVRNALRWVIRNMESGKLRLTTFDDRAGMDANEADLY